MTADRDEQIVAAYAAGDDVATITARYGVTTNDVLRIVTITTAPPPADIAALTRAHNEQVLAAHAAGEDTAAIAARFGLTEVQVLRVVAGETLPPTAPAPAARQSMLDAGIVLLALGLLGPCLIGTGWLAVYYMSATAYPVPSWGYGNLVAGLAAVLIGLAPVTAGRSASDLVRPAATSQGVVGCGQCVRAGRVPDN